MEEVGIPTNEDQKEYMNRKSEKHPRGRPKITEIAVKRPMKWKYCLKQKHNQYDRSKTRERPIERHRWGHWKKLQGKKSSKVVKN